MKKIGVFNKELSCIIADMGHTDSMVICDAGFPIPSIIKRIDLALTPGIPTLIAILSEMIIEKIIVCREIEDLNRSLFKELIELLPNHNFISLSFKEFTKKQKKLNILLGLQNFHHMLI